MSSLKVRMNTKLQTPYFLLHGSEGLHVLYEKIDKINLFTNIKIQYIVVSVIKNIPI